MKQIKKLIFSTLIIFFLLGNVSNSANLKIDSGAALLVETSSDKIIYEKNINTKMYPASVTKILTAILVLENCNLTDIATVSSNAVNSIPTGYVNAKLQPGEELSIRDLLYVLMVSSANDSAVVLAEHVAGTVENFSDMMNEKAISIGCTGTHFVNPNGIHNVNHYTTANDLYLMAKYGMQNSTFREIVSKTSCTLPATNRYPATDRTFSTTNELIRINNNTRPDNYYYKYATGIKTGYTSEAKNCLVASAFRDNLEFIAVVLGGGTTDAGLSARFLDTIHLFDYGYENYTLTKIKEANDIIKTVEIAKGTKETKNLNLLIEDSITVINNKSTDAINIIPDITLNEGLQAPVSKGDIVGTITYLVEDIEYSSQLIASDDVKKKIDISVYLVGGGLVVLILAVALMPKKKKKRK